MRYSNLAKCRIPGRDPHRSHPRVRSLIQPQERRQLRQKLPLMAPTLTVPPDLADHWHRDLPYRMTALVHRAVGIHGLDTHRDPALVLPTGTVGATNADTAIPTMTTTVEPRGTSRTGTSPAPMIDVTMKVLIAVE